MENKEEEQKINAQISAIDGKRENIARMGYEICDFEREDIYRMKRQGADMEELKNKFIASGMSLRRQADEAAMKKNYQEAINFVVSDSHRYTESVLIVRSMIHLCSHAYNNSTK